MRGQAHSTGGGGCFSPNPRARAYKKGAGAKPAGRKAPSPSARRGRRPGAAFARHGPAIPAPLRAAGGKLFAFRRSLQRLFRIRAAQRLNARASPQEGGAQGMFCPIRAPTHTKKAQARNPQAERLPRAQGKASGRGLCAPCPRNSRPAQGRRAATFAFRRSLQRLFRIRAARLGAASARFHPAGLVGKFLRLTGRSGKAWQRRANRRHMGRRKANRPGAPALTGAAAPYANAKRPFRIPAGEGAAQRAPAQWQRLPDAERAAGSAVRA